MNLYIETRVLNIADYIIETGATVRAAAGGGGPGGDGGPEGAAEVPAGAADPGRDRPEPVGGAPTVGHRGQDHGAAGRSGERNPRRDRKAGS